jgi:hypothetical protein
MTHRTGKPWTFEEDTLLMTRYDGSLQCAQLLAEELGRTVQAVLQHCSRLGLAIGRRNWEPDDLETLTREYRTCESVKQLAKRFGRSETSVHHKAWSLGLKRRPCWTPEEDAQLLEAGSRRGYAIRLSRETGRSPHAIRERRSRLNRQCKSAYVGALKGGCNGH